MSSDPILPLVKKAFPSPKSLRKGSDAVILALHCLMVEDGFMALDTNSQPIKGYTPPTNWNTEHEAEWVIIYCRKGALRKFRLHCSLQSATDRLFVHACELTATHEPVSDNIQVMGLQMGNYVSVDAYNTGAWEDVIKNERTLTEMFNEFVLAPLWRLAAKGEAAANGYHATTSADAASSSAAVYFSKIKDTTTSITEMVKSKPSFAVPVAIGVAAVAIGALIWLRPKTTVL